MTRGFRLSESEARSPGHVDPADGGGQICENSLLSLLSGLCAFFLVLGAEGCSDEPLNSPYPSSWLEETTIFGGFTERPKHLDPARSYSSNEIVFTGQIYEPPLQYQYLLRPYRLVPLTAETMPVPRYLDKEGSALPANAPETMIAESVYTIKIIKGAFYQPHPAFATHSGALQEKNLPRYFDLTDRDLVDIRSIADFKETGTKELTADDYVYEIKRLAQPQVQSPIVDFLSGYILGLKEFSSKIEEITKANGPDQFIDLRTVELAGARVIDRYTYEIRIKGKYPQFLYWLAMPFFAPVPYEADRFYSQKSLRELNISLDWYPVGTGPYYLSINDPNRRIELKRNPNFHGETFPSEGEPEDQGGLLRQAGKPLPFIDRAVYSLEKEAIPSWSKFLQGYYDVSGIGTDSFDQAVRFSESGDVTLTEEMESKGIRLVTSVQASTFYTGFNMLDPIVGGTSEEARKLRLAISIAIDTEEFVSIFANGRGIPAQGPIPPEIYGYNEGKDGINPYVYEWDGRNPVRKTLEHAKTLLAESGYPNGRSAKTGEPLVLYFDTTTSGAESKSEFDWLTKKFEALGVQLIVRATDYNTFQDKMAKGSEQIYQWGWNADYPDPENFLFLLYGPNSKVKNGGENASNYDNPEFNALFETMRNLENGTTRRDIIDKMVSIARRDAPWIWGYHPKSYRLVHQWLTNNKPNLMANNTLKYLQVDPQLRTQKQAEWNQPIYWPVILLLVGLGGLAVKCVRGYRKREQATATS